MDIKKREEFNAKLTELLKEYNVNLVPQWGVGIEALPEVKKEDTKE